MWYRIQNTTELLTPCLLFYPARIQQNIERMIAMAGQVERLRPHVKTYKCKEVVEMQVAAGIHKFKCATLAEAEMLASVGGLDVLIAYPLVGAAQQGFLNLKAQYPSTNFSVLVDHRDQVAQWGSRLGASDILSVYIDVNVGMNRTGLEPDRVLELCQMLSASLSLKGLHIYDGHIHQNGLTDREQAVQKAFQPIAEIASTLKESGELELVCGGSISFPIHAQYPDRGLSPGTTLLWDRGYQQQFPDLPFSIAAAVATQVVSKPRTNHICLDLGYKAVAAEMKTMPVHFPQLPNAKLITHSEEHLVIESSLADKYGIGDILYALPWHICPTVAMYDKAIIIEQGKIFDAWQITARRRYS
ncbi:MAG: D-TA family PLP-dependent enzyme [Bacteroidota bacterium]